MGGSTGLWFADCADPRLLRRPNWTPLMVSRRWCDPLTQQLGSGGAVRSKPETTTSQLNPNSTAKSRFEIFSKSIRDLAGFRSVVTTTGSQLHRIHMLPHHIRDHRSAPVSSWFDPHSDLARVVGVDPCRIPFDPRWTSDSIHLSRSEDRMNCKKPKIKKFFWSLLGSVRDGILIHRSDLHPAPDLAGQIRDTSQNTRVPDLSFRFGAR